ncbi:MAG: CoA pyrophosphatase [Promethearchaeota archaeon]|nr:MAG: CoA pyrophosphatase [Candidatus Lokiarchaeota archaeon]
MELSNLIFDETLIKNKLKQLDSPNRLSMQEENFVNSAITFLIIPYNNKPYDLVLIRRTKQEQDKHAGEMSFPGGKFDPTLDKTYIDTAIRETEEELGIPRNQIHLLGCLDDHLTPKGFIITPIVSYIDGNQKMIKQDEEVKEIIKIPITFFTNKKNYRERTYYIRKDLVGVGKFNYRAPNSKKYVIFGATSHIIVNYVDSVHNARLMTPGCRRIRCADIRDKIVK